MLIENLVSSDYGCPGDQGRGHLGSLFSESYKKKTFFNSDSILLKTLIGKLKDSDIDADDLLYKIIISQCFSKNLEIKTMQQVKKINKPWGYEKWIADGNPDFKYALKEILFKANFITSLLPLLAMISSKVICALNHSSYSFWSSTIT